MYIVLFLFFFYFSIIKLIFIYLSIKCATKWFHFTCVGINSATAPKGKWFCSNCSIKMDQPKQMYILNGQEESEVSESSSNNNITKTKNSSNRNSNGNNHQLLKPIVKHKCDTCKREFSSEKHLTAHLFVHAKVQLECEICSERFRHPKSLNFHRRTRHYSTLFEIKQTAVWFRMILVRSCTEKKIIRQLVKGTTVCKKTF